MLEFLQYVIAFVFALGILVTFHEYGHYQVARWFDVKILRFSVGFGRAFYSRRFGADNSEFVLAMIPLGGYVKMLDEREGAVAENERQRAFNNKPLHARFLIVLAGPLFNFIFAVAAYWLVFSIGINGYKPIIDNVEPGSIAASAGARAGQLIVAVNGEDTKIWTSVLDKSVAQIIDGGTLQFTVSDPSGQRRDLYLNVDAISIDDIAGGKLLNQLGITPKQAPIHSIVGQIVPGGAAESAGLQVDDRILTADGQDVTDWSDWVDYVRARPAKTIHLDIERGGEVLAVTLTPKPFDEDGETVGKVGIGVKLPNSPDAELLATESYGAADSVRLAINKTWDVCVMSLQVLGKMLTGEASVKNLSGPISIAQYAGYTAAAGLAAYISFLAIVSVSLGLINLFPIPLLDGGHLMYYLIELVKGSPVSEAVQVAGQQVGLAVLLGLMTLVFYNDIVRLIE